MITEEQIKALAYYIWEQEGRPEGKDQDYYFRARKILEDKEKGSVIELPASPPLAELKPPANTASRGRKKRTK